jgi:hypothetical protein
MYVFFSFLLSLFVSSLALLLLLISWQPFEATTPYVEKDGYAWCVGCHTNRFSTKCKKCKKPVVDTVVKALGAEWHEGCFCCTECAGPFKDGRYFLRDGGEEPFCPGCEERRLKA